MTARTTRSVVLVAALIALLAPVPGRAQDVQDLEFSVAPAWYFVSLQVTPPDPHPLSVFPIAGAFSWDHIWSYDPHDGWRHFSPSLSNQMANALNDLDRIDAVRGYWIHVLTVDPGGTLLAIPGSRPFIQRLEGAGFHAIGPLLAPDAAAANVQLVFADLAEALPDRVLGVWRYDPQSDGFAPLDDFTADCASTPEQCLTPGGGYWLQSGGNILLGSELDVSRDCVILTPDSPVERLDIRYAGLATVSGTAAAVRLGSGLGFFAPIRSYVDGIEYLSPGPDPAPATGPDTSPSCADVCSGGGGCVNLCFVQEATYSLFVGYDFASLAAVDGFSSCAAGDEYTSFTVSLGAQQHTVRVAVQPPIMRGEYSGSLFYRDRTVSQVPLQLFIDDCIRLSGSGVEECQTSRLTGLINPTVIGSTRNALDDDGDGDIDEADEEGKPIPIRSAPSFAPDTVLHGSALPSGYHFQLSGEAALESLDFACEAQTSCDDAGIAGVFRGATRKLILQGERTGPESFAGVFSDRYELVAGSGFDALSFEGRFAMSRSVAPRCVARDDGATRSLDLGIFCRVDDDCPFRCVGDPAIRGFSCVSDADCSGQTDQGTQVSGTCEPYACEFRQLAPASASALVHDLGASIRILVTSGFDRPWPLNRNAVVELFGPSGGITLASASRPTAQFQHLACGSYEVRVTAPGCAPGSAVFDPCASDSSVILQGCSPGVPPPPQERMPTSYSPYSSYWPRPPRPPNPLAFLGRLTGGVVQGAPARLADGARLDLYGLPGQAVVGGVDRVFGLTNELDGLAEGEIRAGIAAFE